MVGCAIARELSLRGFRVIGFEKHPKPCQETSGLNSCVIHSGFHEKPGSLKATLAREGSRLLIQYAGQRDIRLLETGMLIAVPYGSIQAGLWRDASALWDLWRQGRRQQISFDFVFTPRGIREIAPVRALGGIFIPPVCVVDVKQLVGSLAEDARAAGAALIYGTEVIRISVEGAHYAVHLATRETISARILINSAGLKAHEVSEMAGGPKYKIEILRGDYYELAGGVNRWNIRTLVYPAMPPRSRSKGVHFGPRTDGRLFIGPSATPADAPMPKEVFLESGRKFLPSLTDSDLQWAYSGLRPKHAGPNGASDFTIRLDRTNPPLINLIGIDSPGLSASLGIARHVSGMVLGDRSQESGVRSQNGNATPDT